ncbi:MAG TPA: nitronate monooxygenase [Jatrophihabitantaceae bacterium]|jgi:NAD(P)H-dependent flavin oxidoreductase YrpB (nitropropane dioxygenase family)
MTVPLVGAPLSGGPTTPELVDAVNRAGGLGFLAAGYKTATAISEQIDVVRAFGRPFGVNVFAPNPLRVDADEFAAYAARIAPDAARYGVDLGAPQPIEDDDHWHEKIDLLASDPVPVVSFTFGLPDAPTIDTLRRAGSLVLLTVTSPDEARAAAARGPDGLVVQSSAAGGHSGTLTPRLPVPAVSLPDLVRAVRAATDLPLVAAGGVGTGADVAGALAAGAVAVAIGTLLLRTDESGASATHRAALADPARTETVVTRAFSGRPARGLRNAFTDAHSNAAPFGYPALHHLTIPMRRAAAAAGDPERVHLWAGTGFGRTTEGPAAEVVATLARGL